eukprot:s2350_g3.t1
MLPLALHSGLGKILRVAEACSGWILHLLSFAHTHTLASSCICYALDVLFWRLRAGSSDVGHPSSQKVHSSQRSRCYGSIYLSKGRSNDMWCKIFLWAACLVLAGSNTACLPNATDELDRKELVNLVAGESYSIGLWRNGDYPAARLAARVVQIIIQETYT